MKQNQDTAVMQDNNDDKARAAALKAEGIALKKAGKEAESIAPLKEALSLDSSLSDAHFALAHTARHKPELEIDMDAVNALVADKALLAEGYKTIYVMMKERKLYDNMVICMEEVCQLTPDDAAPFMDLGLALKNIPGNEEAAMMNMAHAVNMAPDNKVAKGLFTVNADQAKFSMYQPDVREAMLSCFRDIYACDASSLNTAWWEFLKVDPKFASFIKACDLSSFGFENWLDKLDEKSGLFLKDEFFLEGLRIFAVSSIIFETVLTRMRKYICLRLATLVETGRIGIFENFLYVLAEQCFFNEYVFLQTPEEETRILTLVEEMSKRELTPVELGIIACYRALYKIPGLDSDTLPEPAPEGFRRLVKTQLSDPLEEEALKQTIPLFGDFANEVSRNVKAQYEENPYPRWLSCCKYALPVDDVIVPFHERGLPYNILIAGCGTGRQAMNAAAKHPNAKIVAIDLSMASIAYGMRKAKEAGLDDRIEFVCSDILAMKDWPDTFDMIECSGVLHHMEDPFAGWSVLNDRLKPGGFFKIGLYSEIARKQIVEARAFVSEKGYPATPQGIRDCRRAVFEMPWDNPMKTFLLSVSDFFCTSMVRDLIFHVQEHRMTIPQIRDMLDRLGLTFLKFSLGDLATGQHYDKMFPDDPARTNLDNWTALEKKHPDTFKRMYQFWCRKAG